MSRILQWIGFVGLAIAPTMLDASVANSLPPAPLANPRQISQSHPKAVATLQVTIAGDPADVYLPTISNPGDQAKTLPIALMLPGALVNRSHYSQFASAVARSGFAVIVPTHVRSVPQVGLTGELSEAAQIPATLAWVKQETANPKSPLYRQLDPSRMALLGHSHGGFVGLQAIANTCIPFFCTPPFTRPDAVKVGVFYGVNTQDPTTGKFIPTANANIPVALVQGSLDGVATPEEALATYNLIQTPPKALIKIEGTNHYGITNLNNPPGARPDKSTPTLEQSQGVDKIAQWTARFLRAHLYQDRAALQQIYNRDRPNDGVTITSVLK